MPFVYLGLTRDAGTSKKTNNAYDIMQVHFAQDASMSTRPDRKIGMGLEPQNLPVAQEAIQKFKDLEPMSAINFELQPDPRNMQRNIVVGYKLVNGPKLAATA